VRIVINAKCDCNKRKIGAASPLQPRIGFGMVSKGKRKKEREGGLEVSRGARQQAVSGLATCVGRSETKENELLLLVGGC